MLLNRKYFIAAWQLLRPQTYVLFLIYIGFAYSVAAYSLNLPLQDILASHWLKIAILALAIGLWYISGTGVNDYADYKIDHINLSHDKQRPIVQKLVTRAQLLKFSMVSAILCLLLIAALGDIRVFWLFLIVTLLQVAYSLRPFRISHRGALGPLLLPIGYIVLPVYSVYLVCGVDQDITAVAAMAGLYVHFLARIVLKDFRDIVGDKKYGKKTILIQLGQKKVCYLAITAFILSTGIFAVSLKLNSIIYILAIALGFGLTILYKLIDLAQWRLQRVAIMMFGRICTMLICIITFTVAAQTENLSRLRVQVVTACIVAVFLFSMEDIIRIMTKAPALPYE